MYNILCTVQQPRVYSLCIYILSNNQLFVCVITILNLLELNYNMTQNMSWWVFYTCKTNNIVIGSNLLHGLVMRKLQIQLNQITR